MTDPEIVKMASGLSEAQRRALPEFGENWRSYRPIMQKRTFEALITKGLIEEARPDGPVGYLRWRLTPLGLRLRNHLLSEDKK